MLKQILAMGLAGPLLLAGCIPGADVEPLPRPDRAERAACEAAGGEYARGGILAYWMCYMPTSDAGKSCSRSSDCEAICYAETRQCSPVSPEFGCIALLDEDGKRQDLCID